MSSYPSEEWWGEEQEDQTLTRPLAETFGVVATRREEQTDPSFSVHPSFAVEVTPAPARSYAPPHSLPGSQAYVEASSDVLTTLAPIAHGADLRASFASTAAPPRAIPELTLPPMRARFDSEVSTWRKTIPALRRMLGLRPPLQAPTLQAYALGSVPPPSILEPGPRTSSISPLLLVAMASSVVAIVVMSIVGFGSHAREAARVARTRTVSATGIAGVAITDAKVFVDGATKCDALPCEIELGDGVHWITVRSPGYETPASRLIEVGADQPSEVAFELVPSARTAATTAALVAEVAPEAAAPAPVAGPVRGPAAPLPPAPAVAAPSAPRARPSPGAPAALGAGGRLNINAIPAANVVLDGRPIGRTPIMGYRVEPGPHTVVLVGPNGQRAVRGTQVEAGATATVAAKL
jgi:hypothetical protein